MLYGKDSNYVYDRLIEEFDKHPQPLAITTIHNVIREGNLKEDYKLYEAYNRLSYEQEYHVLNEFMAYAGEVVGRKMYHEYMNTHADIG